MTRVAVVLAGCGFLDGAEIREACYTLLALDQAGAAVSFFAPDVDQMHVVDHLAGEPTGETRNVLVESARIARGDILPTAQLDADDFDAIIFPGGFGAAKNLSTFATEGTEGQVLPEIKAIVDGARAANKPMGFICITPASIAAMCFRAKLTAGAADDPAAGAIESLGSTHVPCATNSIVIDGDLRVVSTPAYMDGAARPSAVYDGIKALVDEVLTMCRATVPA